MISRSSIWPCPFIEYIDTMCVHAYLDIALPQILHSMFRDWKWGTWFLWPHEMTSPDLSPPPKRIKTLRSNSDQFHTVLNLVLL